jgi:type II secretory pathway pseudopilin PulG
MKSVHSSLRRTRRPSSRLGFSYVEVLAAVILLALASAAIIATWSIATQAAADKRVTEMGVFVGTQQLEKMKAETYGYLPDQPANATSVSYLTTPTGAASVTYYDRFGALSAASANRGYMVKSWVTPIIDRNGKTDIEDLREIRIEVGDNTGVHLYDTVRTLIAFGGI